MTRKQWQEIKSVIEQTKLSKQHEIWGTAMSPQETYNAAIEQMLFELEKHFFPKKI